MRIRLAKEGILRLARVCRKDYARAVTTPFTIRCAVAADLDALIELEQRSFSSDRLSRRQLSYHIRNQSAAFLVASQDRVLLGDTLVFFRRHSQVARLYSLVIAEQARGHGLGRELLAAAERIAGERGCLEMRLEVRSDNQQAIKLYEKAGYTLRDVRPGYYEDGADARRYQKPLL